MTAARVAYHSYAVIGSAHPHTSSVAVTLVAVTSAERMSGLLARGAAIGWGLGAVAGAAERVAVALVSLGIIPAGAERHCLAQGSFWIFDEERVQTEGF